MSFATAPAAIASNVEWALARLRRYGANSFSSCLLYEDISQYRCQTTDGFIGYLDSKWILVAMGEPVCDTRDYLKAVEEFTRFAAAHRKSVAFITVGQAFLDAVAGLAPTTLRLGEDWIFPVASYAPRGDHAKKVRSASNQLAKRGGVVREYRPAVGRNPELEGEISQMVDRWLATRSRFQMHFLSLDLCKFADLKRYFYVEYEGRPVAILSCLPIFGRRGYLFEDFIRDPDAPNGCGELMVLEAIRRFRSDSTAMATFGLSPRLEPGSIRNLSWSGRAVTRLGIAAATRLGALHRLYHYRKKFHTGVQEPLYLMKFPAGIRAREVWGILRAFNIF
jgi:phosphatidylglycerol lysyltransferase